MHIIISLLLTAFVNSSQSNVIVTGYVIYKEEPIIGAQITTINEGSVIGTITDIDGFFDLVIPKNKVFNLLVKSEGYASLEIKNISYNNEYQEFNNLKLIANKSISVEDYESNKNKYAGVSKPIYCWDQHLGYIVENEIKLNELSNYCDKSDTVKPRYNSTKNTIIFTHEDFINCL